MESERMTRVMGIVNVTPDSFSDGGKYFRPKEAVRRALNLIDEGADIIDIGAESTRPGSVPISWEEEWSRLEPVLKGLSPQCPSRRKGLSPQSVSVQSDLDDRANLLQKDNSAKNKDKISVIDEGPVPTSEVSEGSVPISVDTYHPETAMLAVEAGAGIINCVYPEPVEEMLAILREKPHVELEGYFATYPGVKKYMDSAIADAREKGYVETAFARRRYLHDINSRNAVARGVAERNAINAPIQGSAADIMKLAMIEIFRRFREEGIRSKMILQVHDEVVVDTLRTELDDVRRIVKESMEQVAQLRVPLISDAGIGTTWLEAH